MNANYKTYELHKSFVAILSMDPDLQTKEQVQHESDFLGWLRTRDHQNMAIDRILQNRNAYNALLDLINSELSRF